MRKVWNLLQMTPAYQRSSDLGRPARSEMQVGSSAQQAVQQKLRVLVLDTGGLLQIHRQALQISPWNGVIMSASVRERELLDL